MEAKRHYDDAAEGLRLLVCGVFMLAVDVVEGLGHCIRVAFRKLFGRKTVNSENGGMSGNGEAEEVDVEEVG